MAIASILAGIVSGLLSFGVALVAGQGLAMAALLYVLGGVSGFGLVLAVAALRGRRRAPVRAEMPLSPARA